MNRKWTARKLLAWPFALAMVSTLFVTQPRTARADDVQIIVCTVAAFVCPVANTFANEGFLYIPNNLLTPNTYTVQNINGVADPDGFFNAFTATYVTADLGGKYIYLRAQPPSQRTPPSPWSRTPRHLYRSYASAAGGNYPETITLPSAPRVIPPHQDGNEAPRESGQHHLPDRRSPRPSPTPDRAPTSPFVRSAPKTQRSRTAQNLPQRAHRRADHPRLHIVLDHLERVALQRTHLHHLLQVVL